MEKQRFCVSKDHLKLIRHFYVDWDDCEYGAPQVDPKRPYGNSDVEHDIAYILGWKAPRDGELTEEQSTKARALHMQTQTALQIVLSTGKFKAGEYVAEKYSNNWKLVRVIV